VKRLQSDTFEREQQNKTASGIYSRAKLVLEIEAFMVYREGSKPAPRWLANLRVLFSLTIPYGKSPRFLHVLKPKSTDEQAGEEWQGRMREMSNRFKKIEELQLPALSDQVVSSQQATERKITDQMDAIQTQITDQIVAIQKQNDENHTQTKARVDSIEHKIERLNTCVHAFISAISAVSEHVMTF
jgi:hypothetical protein